MEHPPTAALPHLSGVSDAAHVPFSRTVSQGHSQSKCMLMRSLKELAAPVTPHHPHSPPTYPLSAPPDAALGLPGKGAADATVKEDRQQKICRAVESHLATRVDRGGPTAADSVEVWMFDGEFKISQIPPPPSESLR